MAAKKTEFDYVISGDTIIIAIVSLFVLFTLASYKIGNTLGVMAEKVGWLEDEVEQFIQNCIDQSRRDDSE